MDHPQPRRRFLQSASACGLSLWLPAPQACEAFASTLRITHPWTRATAPDATSAVVCMRFDEVTHADRLILVESPVAASAGMGMGIATVPGSEPAGALASRAVDFPIPAGQESHLAEAGTHVRLLGLKFPLEVGRAYPLRLGFDKGGIVDTELTVDYVRFR